MSVNLSRKKPINQVWISINYFFRSGFFKDKETYLICEICTKHNGFKIFNFQKLTKNNWSAGYGLFLFIVTKWIYRIPQNIDQNKRKIHYCKFYQNTIAMYNVQKIK